MRGSRCTSRPPLPLVLPPYLASHVVMARGRIRPPLTRQSHGAHMATSSRLCSSSAEDCRSTGPHTAQNRVKAVPVTGVAHRADRDGVCCLRSGENAKQFSWNRVIFACLPSPRHACPEPGDKQWTEEAARVPSVLVAPFVCFLVERPSELGTRRAESSPAPQVLYRGRRRAGIGPPSAPVSPSGLCANAERPPKPLARPLCVRPGPGFRKTVCALAWRTVSDTRAGIRPAHVGRPGEDRAGPE